MVFEFGRQWKVAGAVFIAIVLLFTSAAPFVSDQAYASIAVGTSAGTSTDVNAVVADPAQTAKAKKAAKVTAARKKIATASARLAYSRLTTRSSGTGTKYYQKMVKRNLSSYYNNTLKRMQCNVPVVTAVRSSGIDKKFPTTIPEMYKYMKKSKKWTCLGNYNGKTSSLLPGDVLLRVAGVTTYKVNGVKRAVSTNHTCLYVGKKIAKSVYKKYLKGSDADKGSVGSSRVFVNARMGLGAPSQRRAACLESQKQVCADSRLLVFRYVG